MRLKFLSAFVSIVLCNGFAFADANPFLAPGQKRPAPPPVVKPAPPPPKPISRNPNLEFRGYYKFQGEWKFALFDKSKNEGVWLSQGEAGSDGTTKIESFDSKSEEIVLSGGFSLSLKKPEGRTLPIAGMQKPKPGSVKSKLPVPARIPAPVRNAPTRTR
jgi:hypothetical protein